MGHSHEQGDLIAVDITGHDFIGLGFDVCGSQQDGIFIKSVLARGPARESGCIQAGDQIKSINISFDQMSLQDAYDIINSGSPYKMRLLLEKRALSQKMLDKMQSARAAITPLSNHHKTAVNHQIMDSQQYLMASELQVADTGNGGLLSATKSYLRRLKNLAAPSSSASTMQMNSHPYQPPVYLGSAAARRLRLSAGLGCVPLGNLAGHTNAAFGANSDDNEISKTEIRSPGSSVALESIATSTNDLGVDSSQDCYHSGNSSHRLHGPQCSASNRRHMDLRMVNSYEDNTDKVRSTPAAKVNCHARRQSMATDIVPHSQHYLEQTQSQPEIANEGDDDDEAEIHRNSIATDSLARTNRPIANSVSVPAMNMLAASSESPVAGSLHKTANRSDNIKEEASGGVAVDGIESDRSTMKPEIGQTRRGSSRRLRTSHNNLELQRDRQTRRSRRSTVGQRDSNE